ncbi:MAG TPA: DNA polymerase III subunit gamma/tau [Candidatus Eisenbacteria bacterium]|nr:DNA polymerase III subunit gamma/tau [Candidatus Eisenbacteria bacterium]
MESKSYVVIARKYRPHTFDEIIGQEHVARTLKNAVALGRIGHAYLFTGPRGVGKTSMARIFAKALNCKNGPTPDPCGKCQACVEIEGARSLDVLEVDGASNRGIDEIRALRENVKFAPALGKFKVYIIDEVHQITSDGFNALLKTLEEPPPHVKFVFATTAANKVPATILSRCQRFDFRRIATDAIASALKEICKKEKIKADEEALFVIAKAADGSLRDSQSILDQIAASGPERITKESVAHSLGSLEEERLVEIADALAARDAKAALLSLDAVLAEGKDPSLFLEKLLEHARNLLFLKVSPDLAELVDAPESHKKTLLRQRDLFSKDELFYFFSVISHALVSMRRFDQKRVPLEIALIKLASRAPAEDLAEAIRMLRAAGPEKKTFNAPPPAAPRAAAPAPPPERKSRLTREDDEIPEIEELPTEDLPAAPAAKAEAPAALSAVWQTLLRALKQEKISVASYLAEGEPREIRGGVARVAFPESLSFHRESLETAENRSLIEKHLSAICGLSLRVEFDSVKETAPGTGLPADPAPGASSPPEGAIQSAINLFGGKIVSRP